MARKVRARTGTAYLGNRKRREVHDLHSEQPNCMILEAFIRGDSVVFEPDTLDQAHVEGFVDCRWCIGRPLF